MKTSWVHNPKTKVHQRIPDYRLEKTLANTDWQLGRMTDVPLGVWVHNPFFQERRRIHASLLDEFLEANFGWEAGKGPHW